MDLYIIWKAYIDVYIFISLSTHLYIHISIYISIYYIKGIHLCIYVCKQKEHHHAHVCNTRLSAAIGRICYGVRNFGLRYPASLSLLGL